MKPTNKTTCREVSRRLMLLAQRQETKQAAFNPLTTTKNSPSNVHHENGSGGSLQRLC